MSRVTLLVSFSTWASLVRAQYKLTVPLPSYLAQTNCSTQFEFEFENSAQFENSPGMDAPARVWCMTHVDAAPGFKSDHAQMRQLELQVLWLRLLQQLLMQKPQ